MKKAQGLPMNVIVIAALVLLVLIVLAIIFGGKVKEFGAGVSSCKAKGGDCKSSCDLLRGEYQVDAKDCQTCCINPWGDSNP
jgi:hypothetical protein